MLRQIVDADHEQFVRLLNMFRDTELSFQQFSDILHKKQLNSEIWVYEIDKVIRGTATVMFEDKFIFGGSRVAHVEDVVVDNNFRRQGIGRLLIKKLQDRAKQRGCYKTVLVCSEDNKAFYEKCDMEHRGFQMSFLTS